MNQELKEKIKAKYPNIDLDTCSQDVIDALSNEIKKNSEMGHNLNKQGKIIKRLQSDISNKETYIPKFKKEDLTLTENLSQEIKESLTPAQMLERDDKIKIQIQEEEARKKEFELEQLKKEKEILSKREEALDELILEIVLNDEDDFDKTKQELKNFNINFEDEQSIVNTIKKAYTLVKSSKPVKNSNPIIAPKINRPMFYHPSDIGNGDENDNQEEIDKRVAQRIKDDTMGVSPSGSLDLNKVIGGDYNYSHLNGNINEKI